MGKCISLYAISLPLLDILSSNSRLVLNQACVKIWHKPCEVAAKADSRPLERHMKRRDFRRTPIHRMPIQEELLTAIPHPPLPVH
jgi:hypothetical protein